MTSVAFMAFCLAEYVRALPRFEWWVPERASHAGEVLVNAVLQSGVSYRTVVAPRVASVRLRYPEAATVKAFHRVLHKEGAYVVLQWKHHEKPSRLVSLTDFVYSEDIDSISDLCTWLSVASNRRRLLRIHGIGPKTVDYLGGLVGVQGVAVDRHLRSFATKAGIACVKYDDMKRVVEYAADMLGVKRSVFDYSIWRHETASQGELFAQARVNDRRNGKSQWR